MKKLVFASISALLVHVPAVAGVLVYTGLSSEKLTIEDAPKVGKDVAMVKFEGVESPWADKVIQTKREGNPNGDRYSFEYDLELSSGVKKRTYTLVVGAGYELKNGSRLKKIELFYPDMPNHKPIELVYDEALSKSSQKADLIGQFKKSPFKPDVD